LSAVDFDAATLRCQSSQVSGHLGGSAQCLLYPQ